MAGGFHPWHSGHSSLYQSAQKAFPGAEVFVAATNDTSARPFPFAVKEKLAKLAGVAPGHFVQVKSPFRAEEITSKFDLDRDRLIFVRSEKDANTPPQAGGVKKDGSAAYLQPLAGQTNIRPFKEHAYMAYLPTVEFGPGMTSATEIRTAWPTLNEKRKTALVMSLYPATQKNPKLAVNVVKMLDTAMGVVDESALGNLPRPNKRNQFKSLHRLRKQRGLDEQGVAEGQGSIVDKCASLAAKYFNSAGLQQQYDIGEYIKANVRQGVAEGVETPQQQQVRAAISKGMEKWDQNGLATYQSQPAKRHYFASSDWASGQLKGINSIDPDGTVVIELNDTTTAGLVKKLAALGGMPGVKTRQLKMTFDLAKANADGVTRGDVAEASNTMQRYGQTIIKRARAARAAEQAARAAEPEPKKEEPPASSDYSSMSTRDYRTMMQQLKKPKNKNVAAAPDYMEENIKRQ